jgi:hypothetical protein
MVFSATRGTVRWIPTKGLVIDVEGIALSPVEGIDFSPKTAQQPNTLGSWRDILTRPPKAEPEQARTQPLPWMLMSQHLQFRLNLWTLLYQGGEGMIQHLTLTRPTVWLAGPQGAQTLARHIGWLQAKQPRSGTQPDTMAGVTFEANDYTLVSSALPQGTLALEDAALASQLQPFAQAWQGTAFKLAGTTLRAGRQHHQQAKARGDITLWALAPNQPNPRPQWQPWATLQASNLHLNEAPLLKRVKTAPAQAQTRAAEPWTALAKPLLASLLQADATLEVFALEPLFTPLQQQGYELPKAKHNKPLTVVINSTTPLAPSVASLLQHDKALAESPQRDLHLSVYLPQDGTTLTKLPLGQGRTLPSPLVVPPLVVEATLATTTELTHATKASLSLQAPHNQHLTLGAQQLPLQSKPTHPSTAKTQLSLTSTPLALQHWHWLAPLLPTEVRPVLLASSVTLQAHNLSVQRPAALGWQRPTTHWQPAGGWLDLPQAALRTTVNGQTLLHNLNGKLVASAKPKLTVNAQLAKASPAVWQLLAQTSGLAPQAKLTGKLSVSQPQPLTALQPLLSLVEGTDSDWLSPQHNHLSGTVDAQASLSGTLHQPRLQGRLLAQQAGLLDRATQQPLALVSGTTTVKANGQQTNVQLGAPSPLLIEMGLGNNPLRLSGNIALPSAQGKLTLEGQALQLAKVSTVWPRWRNRLLAPNTPDPLADVTLSQGLVDVNATLGLLGQHTPPTVAGQVALTQGAASLPTHNLAFNATTLKAQFTPTLLTLNTLSTRLNNEATLNAQGQWQPTNGQWQGQAATQHLPLSAVLAWAKSHPSPATAEGVATLNSLSGELSAKLTAQGNSQQGWFSLGQSVAQLANVKASTTQHPSPVVLPKLVLQQPANSAPLTLASQGGQWGPVGFSVKGVATLPQRLSASTQWTKLPHNVALTTDPIPMASLRTEASFWQPLWPQGIPSLKAHPVYNAEGSMQLTAQHTHTSGSTVEVAFDDAGFYQARTFAPLHHINGQLRLALEQAQLTMPEPLNLRIGNGAAKLHSLALTPQADGWLAKAHVVGRLSELEINNLVGNNLYYQPTEFPLEADGVLELEAFWPKMNASSTSAKTPYLTWQQGMVLQVREENIGTKMPLIDQASQTLMQWQPVGQRTSLPLATELPPPLPATDQTAEAPPKGDVPEPTYTPSQLASPLWPHYRPVAYHSAQGSLTFEEGLRLSNGQLLPFGTGAPLRHALAWPMEGIMANDTQLLDARVWTDDPIKLTDYNPVIWNELFKIGGGTANLAWRWHADLANLTPPASAPEGSETNDVPKQTAVPAFTALALAQQPTHLVAPELIPSDTLDKDDDTFDPDEPLSRRVTTNHQADDTLPPLPLQGWLTLKDVALPNLDLDALDAQATWDTTGLTLDIPKLQSLVNDLSLKLVCQHPSASPLLFDQGTLSGKSLYIDGLQTTLAKWTKQGLAPLLNSRPASRRWLAADTVALPFELQGIPVTLKEAIIDNIVTDNVNATLNLYPNGYIELNDMSFETAKGQAKGRLFLHPSRDNLISLTLDSNHLEANALAKVLLDAPNEIFGELSGRIQFTTSGGTQEELVQNASGLASFSIEEGRLPSVAKIETLLTAANVVRGGLLGLNLGNLVRSLKAFDTNYFALLYGDFQIADGVLYTRNLVSDGENLDLLIKGGIRLDNGIGNLTVVGNMSQNVKGALGKVGQLSLRNLVRHIPLLGYLPKQSLEQRRGLVDYLPGVGFVPGVGGVPSNINTFSVKIEGPPDDPASVKDLKWLD